MPPLGWSKPDSFIKMARFCSRLAPRSALPIWTWRCRAKMTDDRPPSWSPSARRSVLSATNAASNPDDLDSAGIEPGVLDDLEKGRLDPPFDLFLGVARALGVTPGIIARRVERIGGQS
jgi:hypothetical protein